MSRADQILDIAQELIQTRGYNGFSFQDISKRLGIKKASVQFYYPKKADLGQKVVHRYSTAFQELTDGLDANPDLDAHGRLNAYLKPFYQVSQERDLVCLCGVLGGEFVSLPAEVQAEVAGFFKQNEVWLAGLLEWGRERDQFHFKMDAMGLAKTFFGALQGALIISRGHEDRAHFDQVSQVIRELLQ